MSTLLTICLALMGSDAPKPDARACVVVVVGTPGTPDYAGEFRRWAGLWRDAATRGGAEAVVIGLAPSPGSTTDRDRLHTIIESRATGTETLWIVLIGHGTYDGHAAKFNLRGPDLTDQELAAWLAPVKRPLALIDCTAGSAPFLNRLSAPGRVVVTATRSGSELNYARFGQYLAESIADPHADLDKDGQVSLLEAYLSAAHRVDEYYRTHAQLATEHALLDDNGDRLGTPPDWFQGVRATRRARDGAALDGVRAHQLHLVASDRERSLPAATRGRRDALELAIAALRDRKETLPEAAYYAQLEPLLVELAHLYGEEAHRQGRERQGEVGRGK